jgi:DNA-binding transcriptional regulator YiaG
MLDKLTRWRTAREQSDQDPEMAVVVDASLAIQQLSRGSAAPAGNPGRQSCPQGEERIRRARGLHQSEVAERAGVTRAYLSLCEQGWYPPPARQRSPRCSKSIPPSSGPRRRSRLDWGSLSVKA